MTPDLFGKLPALFVAHVARGRADEPRDAVLFHVLAHVNANHQLFIVKEKFRERARQLRLSYTGRPKKNEGADGALGVGKSGAAAAHGVGHARKGLVLTDNALA